MNGLDIIEYRNALAERRCTRCGTRGETRPNRPYDVRAYEYDACHVRAILCERCVNACTVGRAIVTRPNFVRLTPSTAEQWGGEDIGEGCPDHGSRVCR